MTFLVGGTRSVAGERPDVRGARGPAAPPAVGGRQALPRELHLTAAKQGFLGVSFPEEVGGTGGGLLDSVALTEALMEAGASGGLIAGAVHPRDRAAAHRRRAATPTSSTGSSGRRSPAS